MAMLQGKGQGEKRGVEISLRSHRENSHRGETKRSAERPSPTKEGRGPLSRAKNANRARGKGQRTVQRGGNTRDVETRLHTFPQVPNTKGSRQQPPERKDTSAREPVPEQGGRKVPKHDEG